ncbi:MAG: hypothetical protein QM802_10790 [Agriterribacter sp.]
MFTSKDDLKLLYGINMEIGKFFVDRKVPANNLYWKERYLYINPMPGYLFIPLYTDIQYRLGFSKATLLSEAYVQFMEQIMHSIAKQEFENISLGKHVEECVAITKPVCKNNDFLDDLQRYFAGQNIQRGIRFGTSIKALNRVDTYLFALCFFNFDEATKKKLIDAWHALMTFYLIEDDLDDIKKDFEAKEDNTILEAGLSDEGIKIVESFMDESYNVMNAVNPVFANRIDYSWQTTDVRKIVDSFLKESGEKLIN